MVDDLKTLEVPESVDNPLGLKGKLAEVTEKVTQAAADQGMKDKNLVRTGFPWLVAGGIGVVGLLIAEPLGAIGKAILGVPRGLSKQIGKQVEKIPYIGLILSAGFAAITEGIEALGAASGYIATGVASFLTFKMLQTQGTGPGEKPKDVPKFAIPRGNGRVTTADEKVKSAAEEKPATEETKSKKKKTPTTETESVPEEAKAGGEGPKKLNPAEVEFKEVLENPTASRKGTFVLDEYNNWREYTPAKGEVVTAGTRASELDLPLVDKQSIIDELNKALQDKIYDRAYNPEAKALKAKAAEAVANTKKWGLTGEGLGVKPTIEQAEATQAMTEAEWAKLEAKIIKLHEMGIVPEFDYLAKEMVELGKANIARANAAALEIILEGAGTTAAPEVRTADASPAVTPVETPTAAPSGKSVAERPSIVERLTAKAPGFITKPSEFIFGGLMDFMFVGSGFKKLQDGLSKGGNLSDTLEGAAATTIGVVGGVSKAVPLVGIPVDLGIKAHGIYQNPMSVIDSAPTTVPKVKWPVTKALGNATKLGGQIAGGGAGVFIMYESGKELLKNNSSGEHDGVANVVHGTNLLGGTAMAVGALPMIGVGTGAGAGATTGGAIGTAGTIGVFAAPFMVAGGIYYGSYEQLRAVAKESSQRHENWLTDIRPQVTEELLQNNFSNQSAVSVAHQQMPSPEHFRHVKMELIEANAKASKLKDPKLKEKYYTETDPDTKEFIIESPEKIEDRLLWLERKLTKRIFNNITETSGLGLDKEKYPDLFKQLNNPSEIENLLLKRDTPFGVSFLNVTKTASKQDIDRVLRNIKDDLYHLARIQTAKAELGSKIGVYDKRNELITEQDGSTYFVPKQPVRHEKITTDAGVIPSKATLDIFFKPEKNNNYNLFDPINGTIAVGRSIGNGVSAWFDPKDWHDYKFEWSNKGSYIVIDTPCELKYDKDKDAWVGTEVYRDTRDGVKLIKEITIAYEPITAPIPTYQTYYNSHQHEVENLVAKIEANPLPKESASAALQLSEKFRAASMNGNEIGGTGNRVFDDYVGAIAGYWEDKEKAAKLPAGDAHGKAIIAVDERKIGEIYLAMQLRQEALEEHKDSFNDHKKFIENKDNLAKMEVLCANQIAWNDYKDACKSYETVCAQTKTFDKETAEILRADAEITMYLRMPMLNKAMQEEVTKTSVEQIKGDKEFLTKLRIIGETADMNATVTPTNAAPEIMPVDQSPKPVANELSAVATKVAPVKYRTVLVQQGTTLSHDMQIAGQPLMAGFVPSQVGGMPQGFIPSGQLGVGSAFANHDPALGQPGFMPVNNPQNGFVPLPDNKPWLPIYVPQHIEPPSGFISVDNPQAAVFNVPAAIIKNEKSAQKNKDVATMTPQDIGANLIANLTGAWQEVLGENGVPMQTALPIKSSTDKSQQA